MFINSLIKNMIKKKSDANSEAFNEIVAICEKFKKDGCSSEAAGLIEKECARLDEVERYSLMSTAEDLQYCNNIGELKVRFAVNEEPDEESRADHSRLDPIFGAIYGDIIGSKYEGHKTADISDALDDPMQPACRPTDDSILTIATLRALRHTKKIEYYEREMTLKDIDRCSGYPVRYNAYTRSYRDMAKMFPTAGYGSNFICWAANNDERPYGSLGNGSAMRVSPVGAMYDDINDVIEQAAVSAMATHNHVEGVKGAVVTAVCIWMARNGYSKKQIYAYMKKHYSYGASKHIFENFSYEEASHRKINQVECSYSVPAAVISFFCSKDYMDAIKLSACVGFDTDTNACICGGIAGAYYGIPDNAAGVVLEKTEDLFGHNPFMNEILGDTIRTFRIKNGYSEEDMSAKTGIALERYKKTERGFVNVSYDAISKIAKALGINVGDITEKV